MFHGPRLFHVPRHPHRRRRQRRAALHQRRRALCEELEQRWLLSTTPTDAPINATEAAGLNSSLDQLVDFAGGIDAYADMNHQLVGFDLSVGQLLDMPSIVGQHLRDVVQGYLVSDASPTTNELLSELQSLSGSFGNVTIDVDSMSVEGGLFQAPGLDELRFDLPFSASRTVAAQPFDLDEPLSALGVVLDDVLTVSATITADFDLSFGFQRDNSLTPARAAFIRLDNYAVDLQGALSAAVPNAQVGLLSASANNSMLTPTATLQIAVMNPDSDVDNNLTIQELASTSVSDLLDVMATGSVSGGWELAVSPPVLGLVPVMTPGISLTIGDWFDPAATANVTPTGDFAELSVFSEMTAKDVLDTFEDAGDWWQGAQEGILGEAPVPFLADVSLGDATDLATIWDTQLLDLIRTAEDVPSFDTVQQLLTLLQPVIGVGGAQYDMAADELTIALDFGGTSDHLSSATFGVQGKYDGLGRIAGQGVASVTGGADFAISWGIDFSPEALTGATPLSQLNGGFGVRLNVGVTAANVAPAQGKVGGDADFELVLNGTDVVPVHIDQALTDINTNANDLAADINIALIEALAAAGWRSVLVAEAAADRITLESISADVHSLRVDNADELGFDSSQQNDRHDVEITSRDGNSYEVSLSGSTALSEVASAIQAGTAGDVAVAIDSASERLILSDLSTPSGSTFAVTLAPGATSGTVLGIVASDVDNDGVITGQVLAPLTPLQRTFIEDAAVVSSVAMPSQSVEGDGQIGFLEVDVVSADGQAELTIDFKDVDTGTPGGRLKLTEWFQGAAADIHNVADLTATGDVNLHLVAPDDVFGGQHPADPTVTLSWADLTAPTDVVIADNADMQPLRELDEVGFADILGALQQVPDFLELPQPFADLQPSVPSLIQTASVFSSSVTTLSDTDATSLQEVPGAIAAAFSLSPASISVLVVDSSIQVEFTTSDSATGSDRLFEDLSKWEAFASEPKLAGIPTVIESGTSSLSVSADSTLELSLGIDLLDLQAPFLFDKTTLQVDVASRHNATLDFAAQLGAVVFDIQDASRTLDGDGNPATADVATFTASLGGDMQGRVPFDAIPGSLSTGVSGALSMTLPLFESGTNNPVGDLALSVTDISSPTGNVTLTSPDLSSYVDAIDLSQNLPGVQAGLDSFFVGVKSFLRDAVFANELPLLGTALQEEDGPLLSTIEQLRSTLYQELENQGSGEVDVLTAAQVQAAIFASYGPPGMNVLVDTEAPAGVTIDDVLVTPPLTSIGAGTPEVIFDYRITAPLPPIPQVIAGNCLGTPPLNVCFGPGSTVFLGGIIDFPMRFVVSDTAGFYYDPAVINNANISFTANTLLANGVVTINSLPITVNFADQPTNPSTLTGNANVTFSAPTGIVLPTCVTSLTCVAGTATATANVHLDLEAQYVSGMTEQVFPSLRTELHVQWQGTQSFVGPTPPADVFGEVPYVEFRDLTVDLSDSVEFIEEFFVNLRAVIEPIRLITSPLNTPIPVISQLFGDTSVIDILAGVGAITDGWQTLFAIIDGALALSDPLADLAEALPSDTEIIVGGLRTHEDIQTNPIPAVDFRNYTSIQSIPFDQLVPQENVPSILDQLDNQVPTGEARAFYEATQDIGGTGAKLNLLFFTEPDLLLRLLTSLDPSHLFSFDIVTLDLPPLELGVRKFTFPAVPIPVPLPPIVGPWGLQFEVDDTGTTDIDIPILSNGGPSLWTHFDLGYDSYGLELFADGVELGGNDIANGFFLDDHVTADGKDLPEFRLNASIAANLSPLFSQLFSFVEIGFQGGAEIDMTGNLRDFDGDGKARLYEIQAATSGGNGTLCMFDTEGGLEAFLGIRVGVGIPLPFGRTLGVSRRFDIARRSGFPGLDFPPSCNYQPLILAEETAAGELTLNMGPRAVLRDNDAGNESDTHEEFRVRQVEGGGVVVEFTRLKAVEDDEGQILIDENGSVRVKRGDTFRSPEFVGITQIIAYGGEGDDRIIIDEAVLADMTIHGDEGNDRMVTGSGSATVYAGAGNDEVTIRGLASLVFGEDGHDKITGGAVDDTLHGGEGDDEILGLAGNDDISGGAGSDTIYGDEGVDSIDGGTEVDTISGGDGADIIEGGSGDDEITGDEGNDSIDGEEGDDIISGGAGLDTISGGPGSDMIEGNAGSDVLRGDGGMDTLFGGDDADLLEGGEGDDVLYGDLFSRSDSAALDPANQDDNLLGQAGNDTLYGGFGNDNLSGGPDDDDLFAGFTASGGGRVTDVNTLHGDENNDTLYGDLGNDLLHGDHDDDIIIALAGRDRLFGGAGNDILGGGTGSDFVFGGADADSLNGDRGDDFLEPGAGVDLVQGGPGFDLLYNESDTDQTIGKGVLDSPSFNLDRNTFLAVEQIQLVGGGGDNRFTITNYQGGPLLIDGKEGNDTIGSVADVDVRLSDWNLSRTDGVAVGLVSIEAGELWGGGISNEFRFDQFTGPITVDGKGGQDKIIAHVGGGYVVTDGNLVRPTGSDVSHADVEQFELVGGAGNDSFDASAFSGTVFFYGRHGNDVLVGGLGDDVLDGGTGTDVMTGNAGDDYLVAGGGAGDVLNGGLGADLIYGSDDGGDVISGGEGSDTIYAAAGNDLISAGPGDDTVDGGAGDDQIAGDGGVDLIVGGANHDVLYGHNTVGVGDDTPDDLSVDYLYGDHGTGGEEGDAGRDQIFGGGGNDLLFGEGDDDLIDAGGGASNLVDYGAGESGVPSDFIPPPPSSDPPLGPPDENVVEPATLPAAPVGEERWADLAGSALGLGLSGFHSSSTEPSIATGTSGTYVAWSDNRHGNYEIYVAQHTAGVWQELAGSAHGGGISNTAAPSRSPSIALDDNGLPLVAWTEFHAGGVLSDIFVATFNPFGNGGAGAWEPLGDSLAGGGISDTGAAGNPRIVHTANGPVVAYRNRNAAIVNLYVQQFNGGTWSALGAGAASGDGISNSATDIDEFDLATNGSLVAAAWTQDVGGTSQIYLREYSAASWNQLSGSASGWGLSATAGDSSAPSAAYLGSSVFVAWQTEVGGDREIYVARHAGGWQAAGAGANTGGGISDSGGRATSPELAAGGGALHLFWVDDRVAGGDGNTETIYARQWNGNALIEELIGDAQLHGIHPQFSQPSELAAAVSPTGDPFIAFRDDAPGSPEIFLRGNSFNLGSVYYVNDESLADSQYTSGIGNDANLGNLAVAPKATIQDVLDDYNLTAGDVILIDSGSYPTAVAITGGDGGVTLWGAPDDAPQLQGALTVTGDNVTLHSLEIDGGLSIAGVDGATLINSAGNSVFGYGMSAGDAARLILNRLGPGIGGLRLSDEASHTFMAHNTIEASLAALDLDGTVGGGLSDVDIHNNRLAGSTVGLTLDGMVSGVVRGNFVTADATVLQIPATYAGTLVIDSNQFAEGTIGVQYDAGATLVANRISDNYTGVVATVDSDVDGLGFVAGSGQNFILHNEIGVQLTGRMQNQLVGDNYSGVKGSGILGPDSLDEANVITENSVGVDFAGTVQFNRVTQNTYGIDAVDDQIVVHNLVYRNKVSGIRVSGAQDVRIFHNTSFEPTADNIQVRFNARETEIRNNILWTGEGYNIFVDNDSQSGFYSDYNTLHATGTGQLVFWTKDFEDILDWQADVARFDLHSIGTTVVNPEWSRPRFANRARDDYQILDVLAAQRFASPTIDAGDPLTDLAILAANYQNLLTNADFESGVTGWTTSANATTAAADPMPFFGGAYFFAGNIETGFAEQTVDLAAAGFSHAQLDSRDLQLVFGGRMRAGDEQPVDEGELILTFLDELDQPLGDPVTVLARNTTDRWELTGDRVAIPVGTRHVTYRCETTRQHGSSNDAYLDHAFLYVLDDTVMPNQGAVGNTEAEAAGFVGPRLALRAPDLYRDWERDRPRFIHWDSFDNDSEATVRIDLYEDSPDGPEFLLNIAPTAPDTGQFTWIPFADSGVDYDTHGLRIVVSLAGNQHVYDRGTEPFSVPEDGSQYYCNVADSHS